MFEWLFKYPLRLFREGSITYSGSFQWELRILAAVLVALAAYWVYRRLPARVGGRRRWTLWGLRALVLALIVFLIAPPVLRVRDSSLRNRFVVFLVDDSRSMGIKDAAGQRSRSDAATKLLVGQGAEPGLIAQAGQLGGASVFRFADAVQRSSDGLKLSAEGDATDLHAAIAGVNEQMPGVPMAALVLVTDGGHTAASDPLNAARLMQARGVPIFTVGLGDPTPPRDREVAAVVAPRTVRRHSNVEVAVTLSSHGYGEPFPVRLRQKQGDKDVVLAEVKVSPPTADDVRQIRIPLFLDREGVFAYTVEIPAEKDEKIASNNARDFRIEVLDRRLPVLYVEGSPRTEYRFIRGAIFRDKDFRIVTVLRTGKDSSGKDRYLVQGAEGDGEQLKDLLGGFPRTKERLFQFEAVIFGDLEAGQLTPEQMAMTEEFVSRHGGGLLMLGGVNSFNVGGYGQTPIANALPIELAPRAVPYDHREFKVKVAEKGVHHPVMHQSDDRLDNLNIWNSVSPLLGHNVSKGLKPAGVALLEHAETGEPILAVQQYGAGRSAAFTTGGSWFWRMDREIGDKLHERFWRQLVRWLAVGSRPKMAAETDKDIYFPNEPVRLQATVLGADLEPINDAAVMAYVEDPFGRTHEIRLDWVLNESGVYRGQFFPREHGEYKVVVKVANPREKDPVELKTGFVVCESYSEFTRAWQNAAMLKDLSDRTGGRYYAEQDAGRLVQDLKRQMNVAVAAGQVRDYDLWDMPVLFLLLLVGLLTEWMLRRRSNLP